MHFVIHKNLECNNNNKIIFNKNKNKWQKFKSLKNHLCIKGRFRTTI